MWCEERERLVTSYFAAVDAVNKAAEKAGSPNPTSQAWKAATNLARAHSKAALVALHRHRKEHGC
jgi:hypothetical protein